MKNHTLLLLGFLFFFLGITSLSAQKDSTKAGKDNIWWKKGKPYVIITNDGTEYTGEIVGDNDREILFMTKSMGKIYLPKYAIKSINLVDKNNFTNGEFMDPNNHQNFYMAATNALPFKPRELRMTMFYVFGYSGTYAINENVMVGLHTTLIGAPMGASLKTSFKLSEGNYVGTDMHIATMSYIQKSSYVGSIAAKYTYGDDKTNFSLMGGIGFASFYQYYYGNNGLKQNDNSYYMNASIFHRLTKSAGFTAEAWIAPKSNFGLLGVGVRTLKKSNTSWVFGFYNLILQETNYYNGGPTKQTAMYPIPYFGATFKL